MDKYEKFVRWMAQLDVVTGPIGLGLVAADQTTEDRQTYTAEDLVEKAAELVLGESTMQGHPPGLGMKF